MLRSLCVPVGLVVLALTCGTAFAYSGQIKDAQVSGLGVCLRIEICWGPGQTAPTPANTSATASEVDNIDPNDPLGMDPSGAPIGTPEPLPCGCTCQDFWFCFPQNDCEIGTEEYSANVSVNGMNFPANGPGGAPYAENIC